MANLWLWRPGFCVQIVVCRALSPSDEASNWFTGAGGIAPNDIVRAVLFFCFVMGSAFNPLGSSLEVVARQMRMAQHPRNLLARFPKVGDILRYLHRFDAEDDSSQPNSSILERSDAHE